MSDPSKISKIGTQAKPIVFNAQDKKQVNTYSWVDANNDGIFDKGDIVNKIDNNGKSIEYSVKFSDNYYSMFGAYLEATTEKDSVGNPLSDKFIMPASRRLLMEKTKELSLDCDKSIALDFIKKKNFTNEELKEADNLIKENNQKRSVVAAKSSQEPPEKVIIIAEEILRSKDSTPEQRKEAMKILNLYSIPLEDQKDYVINREINARKTKEVIDGSLNYLKNDKTKVSDSHVKELFIDSLSE